MVDCGNCIHHRANGDCTVIRPPETCPSFKSVGSVDTESLKAAKEEQDRRNGRIRRTTWGSNTSGNSSGTWAPPKPPKSNTNTDDRKGPKGFWHNLRKGQRLYFKDKNTGAVRWGKVIKITKNSFEFDFFGRCVELSKSDIGKRLFYTAEAARQYGKTDRLQ